MTSSFPRIFSACALVLAVTTPGWAGTDQKSSASSQEIIKVQEALKAKGEDPGPIDGIMGNKTRAAIKSFQSANGLKATGTMDKQTDDKLGMEK